MCVHQHNCSSCVWLTGQQTAKCVCLHVCVGFIPFFTSSDFHFHPKSFSCHRCHLSPLLSHLSAVFPEERETDRERTRGRDGKGETGWETEQTTAGWQHFVSPGLHMNAKETQAPLTVWQNERSNAWNSGWVDGCMFVHWMSPNFSSSTAQIVRKEFFSYI